MLDRFPEALSFGFCFAQLFPSVHSSPGNKCRKKYNLTGPVKIISLLLQSGMQFTYISGPKLN